MSFGFGKNSGPTAPPSGQAPFGHFPHPHPHPPPPTPSPSPSPFPASNLSAGSLFPSPRSHDAHVRPQTSLSNGIERATTSFSQQHAAPIRTFDAHVRPRSQPSLGNGRSATSNSQQHVAVRHGKQITQSGVSSSQSQKRPFSYSSQDRGTGMSSKLPHLQSLESSRSPPIQYDDDFLRDSSGDVTQGDRFLHRHDKRNPVSGDFSGQSQKRPFPPSSQDLRANMSSKHPHLQNMESSRSPPIQYDDDFLLDPSGDVKQDNADTRSNLYGNLATHRRQSPSSTVASSHSIVNPRPSWSISPSASSQNERIISSTKTADFWKSKELTFDDEIQKSSDFYQGNSRRPSLSPPKLRGGTSGVGRPDFQYKQEPSPSADEMNDDTSIFRTANHSFPKRTRSPASDVGQIIQTNAYSTEDDADREQLAKAKRLARFKTELVDSEPGDSVRYGQTVTKGKISSMKIDHTSVEKSKFPGVFPPGSMEDQDFDNEDLQSSSVIVGLCTDMCPESEREERERKGDLDQYERVDGDRNQSSSTLAVKKYNRTAEREAELIRPMPILLKTMDYLLGLINQSYDDRFLGLYNFLWDRMRAIRMDLRMQHIFNERAITMLEQMIRFHIIAMHELCEFSKGEGFSEGFDAHLNIEQMNKTSVELFQLYDDHRKKGIFIPTEKEFRGYYALLKLDKHPGYKVEPAELSLDLAQMTAEIRQTLEVLFARDVARSCRTSNFIAFFRHARNASYLQACLMHAHFSKLRTQALASLHSGLQYNQGLPVAHAAKWLGMEGEDIESLLEYHGFSIKEFEEPYMVKEGPFQNVDKDYPTRRSLLVHRKKSNTIMKDVLSSNQVMLLPQPKPSKETENGRVKHGPVRPIQIKSTIVSDDGLMDIEAVSSPTQSVQDPQILETPTRSILDPPVLESPRRLQILGDLGTSKGGQFFADNYHKFSADSPRDNSVSTGSPRDNRVSAGSPRVNRVSVGSPKDNRVSVGSPRDNLKPFPSISFHSLPPSPLTPMHGPPNPDALNSPWSSDVQQCVRAIKSPNGLGKQDNFEGLPKSSLDFVADSETKSVQSEVVSVGEVLTRASEARSSIMSSSQDDTSLKEASKEEYTDSVEQVDIDVDDNFDEEVAEAKLRLLLRLWRRRFLRKKYIREQNRFAANAALSSLNFGPPIRQSLDKTTPCQKLNIDQAMNERYKKRQMSMVRWNVSDLVACKLVGKNDKSNCICWKVISFSWLEHGRGDMDSGVSFTQMYLDEWLRYKLIPGRKEEAEEDLVISAPGLSVWRKWAFDRSGDLRCYFSVIKDSQPGNSEKTLAGVDAIIFPISETISWDIQKAQLNNLVASLPAGACIPLLIVSDFHEESFAEFSCTIIDKLGLNDLDESRISRFMVMCLSEEGAAKFHGYFSDEKLKEGLMWLASESHSQPNLFCLTIRELVSHHLNSCLDMLDHLGKKVGPSQCISAFNQALDQSINDIVSASNTNLAGWPCPELFLMDDSTAEFRLVKQFLPTLGWSTSEEVEPLISSLRNSKLPSFSDDLSLLNIVCNSEKNIEDKKQLLQDSLIRYLTQSGILLPLMMAAKESHLMVQKYTNLELHGTVFKVVPSWVPIFRRLFNWQLNSSASFSCKAYVLEQSLNNNNSLILDKLEPEVPNPYISHPSLDEMVEVSCSPLVSKRVRSSPKSFQKMVAIASNDNTIGITSPDFVVEERNQCSEIQVVDNSNIDSMKNDMALVPNEEKKSDRLSQLLDQCSILQDEIEKKLSIYF